MNHFATGLDLAGMQLNGGKSWLEAFVVQLTFVEGGFVLNVQFKHWLVDGYGQAPFMKQWFKRSKALGTGNVFYLQMIQLQVQLDL